MAKSRKSPNTRWTNTACERCTREIIIQAEPPTDPVRLKYRKVCGACLTGPEALELSHAVVPGPSPLRARVTP